MTKLKIIKYEKTLAQNKYKTFMRYSIILIAFFLVGCVTKREYFRKVADYQQKIDSIKTNGFSKIIDTVTIKEKEIVIQEVVQEVKIPIECDSTGKVKPIFFNTGSNRYNASFKVVNDSLVFNLKIDSIKSHFKDLYASKYKKDSVSVYNKIKELRSKEITEKEKIVKTRFPWEFIGIGVAISIILFILYKLRFKL